MKTINVTTNKKTKSETVSKNNCDTSNSKSWFSNLKKSFSNRKNRPKSTEDGKLVLDTQEISKCDNGYSDYDYSQNKTDNTHISNFSNDFLDSFIKNNCSNFYNDTLKSKLKMYQIKKASNSKNQIHSFVNSLFTNVLEHPQSIEKILMMVVEDYINSTCEKMLHDKMRSVYRKIENWTKYPLTRPGFKKTEFISGGNITKPEKSFNIEKKIRPNKRESVFNHSKIQESYSVIRSRKQVTEDFKGSSKVNNSVSENVKDFKSSKRDCGVINCNDQCKLIDKVTQNNTSKIHSIKCNEKSRNPFSKDSNLTQIKNDNDLKKRIGSIKSQNKFDHNSKHKNNQQSSELTETISIVDSTNHKQLRRKSKEMSCKCSRNSEMSGIDFNKTNTFSQKSLKISEVFNIDIKPLSNKTSPKLLSRIPKYHTRLKIDKQNTLTVNDDSSISNYCDKENKEIPFQQNVRPKIRRSVTFLEPRKSMLNSTLSTEVGFRSQWEVRSEINKLDFLSTKSEELNYLISSNISTPNLYETHTRNYSPLFNQSSKYLNSCHVSQPSVNSEMIETIKDNDTEDCTSIMKDTKTIQPSPVFISLQSTPSCIGDVNYPYNAKQSPDHNSSHLKRNFKSRPDKSNCMSNINDSLGHMNNNPNKLRIESDKNFSDSDSINCKIKNLPNSKNYSIIEVINKPLPETNVYGNGSSYREPIPPDGKKNKIQGLPFTNQMDSVNTSYESSLIDDDALISTGSMKSKTLNPPRLELQEIILSDDENTYRRPNSFYKTKKPFDVSQMKTANFSSSLKPEESLDLDNLLKKLKPSYLSLTYNQKISDTMNNSLINDPLLVLMDSNESQNPNHLDSENSKKDKNNNILKHTVASKQKMRDKVIINPKPEKHPMKFSKGYSRIY